MWIPWRTALLALLGEFLGQCLAWQGPVVPTRCRRILNCSNNNISDRWDDLGQDNVKVATRSEFLAQSSSICAMTVVLSRFPVSTNALPTDTGTASSMSLSTALRNLKRAQKKLTALEELVVMNEYLSLKEALRVPPFSELRKSCVTLTRAATAAVVASSATREMSESSAAAAATETATSAEQLSLQYQSFIKSFEAMDSLASLGMRGRKVGKDEFYASYQAVVGTLARFVALAEEQQQIVDGAPVENV